MATKTKPRENAQLPTDLPDPMIAPSPSRTIIARWLVVFAMLVFFIPLAVATNVIRDDAARMDADLSALRVAQFSLPPPAPQVAAILTPLAQTQAKNAQIAKIYPTLAAPRPDWAKLMAAIGNYDINSIALTALAQTSGGISIAGRAQQEENVIAYARALEQSGQFSRVVVQSMQVLPTPTATPTNVPTKTPTILFIPTYTPIPTSTSTPYVAPTNPPPTNTPPPTATPTNTPDLRDAYEPDDAPRPIALGQSQPHNFYPDGDVDAVTFLAKAGRYYRVYTMDLAPGVDTLMNVQFNGSNYTNDDVRLGALSSEIVFQNTGGDAMVVVTISNRGLFGGDKTYRLVAEEMVPTPTPIPTRTLTPTATPSKAALNHSSRAPGLLRPIIPPGAGEMEYSAPGFMPVRFVIIVEPKAAP
ncbi:MAG: PilN domain-containing protein [Chloroflexi bacterium]|nr:PilN domain-containing protein [Chloroflexota bacterium]